MLPRMCFDTLSARSAWSSGDTIHTLKGTSRPACNPDGVFRKPTPYSDSAVLRARHCQYARTELRRRLNVDCPDFLR
jgi:hypothetical protein